MYNVGPTSSTLVRRCTNVIQMCFILLYLFIVFYLLGNKSRVKIFSENKNRQVCHWAHDVVAKVDHYCKTECESSGKDSSGAEDYDGRLASCFLVAAGLSCKKLGYLVILRPIGDSHPIYHCACRTTVPVGWGPCGSG